MHVCPDCGKVAVRIPRTASQKILNRAIFRCEGCAKKTPVRRAFFILFRPFVECPRCGTRGLRVLAKKDRLDGVSPNPLRRILFLVGSPLYHCTYCRMQFRDWRRLDAANGGPQ